MGPHLSSSQIDELLQLAMSQVKEGAVDRFDENVQIHLKTCESCQEMVRAEREAMRRFAQLEIDTAEERSGECPPDDTWLQIAVGVAPDGLQGYLSHAAECDHCGPLLQSAVEDFSEDLTGAEGRIAGLRSSLPEWQKSLASKLASKEHSPEVEPLKVPLNLSSATSPGVRQRWFQTFLAGVSLQMRWGAAAFLALLVIAGAILFRREEPRPVDVDRLLAQAYASQRTLELRVEGAPYAPIRQERGAARSALGKSEPLLQAEYEIKKGLRAKPEDAGLIAAEGRAELLEWQYDEAIKSLTHALDLNPNSPGVLSDLATAFTQRGDTEGRPIDYGQAIELLGRALQQDPGYKIALFNRAVVEERLDLFEEARKDWENYLRLDPQGGWAVEARQRLEALLQKQRTSSTLPSAERDPLRAILALRGRSSGKDQDPSWPESLDEEYLSIAITDWLPSLGAPPGKIPEADPYAPAWRALTLLATVMSAKHGDRWLADVLSTRFSPSLFDGWNQLTLAVKLNSDGEFDSAAEAATRAEFFLQGTSRAAFLRALWEHAYALQRSQQGSSCLRVIERAIGTGGAQRYPWIAAQFLLEHSICSAMVGQMGNTKSQVLAAISLASSGRYPTLLLRTYHIMGIQAASQDPDVAWKWFLKGLNRHWAGAYRPFRIYQFCAEMSLTAENRGQWHLAQTLMDEAVVHISRTSNHLMEAVARHDLAVDLQMAGYPQGALEEFRKATDLFSSLPPTPAVKASHFSSLVYQASLLSQQVNDDSALHLLDIAKTQFSEQSQYWTWLHYYETLGEVLLRQGNDLKAEYALSAAVRISESALATIGDEDDRSNWERQSMRAYRSLVELELERKHDPRRALEIWEWYIAAPIRIPKSQKLKPDIDFASLASNPPLPRLDRFDLGSADLRNVTIISFAELRVGPVAWVFDDRGVKAARLKISTAELNRAAERFARLCSDPSSDVNEIHQVGRELYDWLFAPFESHLDPARTLVIESDGPLQGVPFGALVSPKGKFLLQNYALVNSPGFEDWSLLRRGPDFSPRDRVLVVSAPSGTNQLEMNLPFLPDSGAEAQSVSSTFYHPRLLLGSQATIEAVRRDLATTRVFHFAGHAITSETGGGLLFEVPSRIETEGESRNGFLDVQGVSRLPLQQVDLVVLSACTTGRADSDYASPHGLAQAFLRSGVPHVVASRWDVDSVSTRIFMRDFYTYLVMGRSPATAIALAARIILQRPETAHPYYWAAFNAFGLS